MSAKTKKYIYILWERKINNDGTLEPWLLEGYVDTVEQGKQWVDMSDKKHFRKSEKVARHYDNANTWE